MSKVLAEYEQSQVRLSKEEKSTFMKLTDIYDNVEAFRETLKHYEQTSEYLLRVQKASEHTLGKLENFRERMAAGY